jgi:hypothetical protein
MLSQIFDDTAERTRSKVIGIYALLIAGNVGAWLWALIEFHDRPLLLGTAFLAYSFGLRHAFDADHIAARQAVVQSRSASFSRSAIPPLSSASPSPSRSPRRRYRAISTCSKISAV